MKRPVKAHFDARGSNCPICKRDFRYGCDHSIAQAEARIEADYLGAVVRYEMAKAQKRAAALNKEGET